MKDRLEVYEERYQFRIRWVINGDEGAALGEDRYTERDLAHAPAADREHILATLTAAETDHVNWNGRDGYHWETRAQATKALQAIRAALKSDGGAPWPEWAVKAKGEGWTPPKGWKPS